MRNDEKMMRQVLYFNNLQVGATSVLRYLNHCCEPNLAMSVESSLLFVCKPFVRCILA